MTTTVSQDTSDYNTRILGNGAIASTWRTARPGHDDYALRISGIFPTMRNDEYWFASANERTLWALAHMGSVDHPNAVGTGPRFTVFHVNGWVDPMGDQNFAEWFRFDTCSIHSAVLTPTIPGEPALECGMCVADHDANA